jgi:DNA-binding FadR family transcriptional regulator
MAQTIPRIQAEKPVDHHRKIYDAIRERKPEDARRLMLEHIAEAAAALTDSKK